MKNLTDRVSQNFKSTIQEEQSNSKENFKQNKSVLEAPNQLNWPIVIISSSSKLCDFSIF